MLPILFTLLKIIWFIVIIVALWNPTKKFVNWLSDNITRGDVVQQIFQIPIKMFKLNQLDKIFNNFYKKIELSADFFSDIYLLRIPIIGGLTLFGLPIVAQFFVAKFFQNLFVMESEMQLSLVMLFTTLSSLSIVSFIKNIIVIKDLKLNLSPQVKKQDIKKANRLKILEQF